MWPAGEAGGGRNQAQLDEFIQQVDPEAGKVVHPQVNQDKLQTSRPPGKNPPSTAHLFSGGSRGTAAGWADRKVIPPERLCHARPVRLRRFWWLRRVLWMAVVIIIGIILTFLVNRLASAASTNGRWALAAHLGFVISVILDSIKVLYESRRMPLRTHAHPPSHPIPCSWKTWPE